MDCFAQLNCFANSGCVASGFLSKACFSFSGSILRRRLGRQFSAERLNEKWLTDVTKFKQVDGGKLHLSAILDLKDQSIVSYAGRSNNNRLAFDAFGAAVKKHPGPGPCSTATVGFNTPVGYSGKN